jgi:hypothetical protein
MNNRMSDLYSGLGSFVQPRRMQEGGQALTDLQRNVLAEQGLTPAEAQNAVRMIIAGQGDMLSPEFKELSGTGYWRRVGQAFNMVDASGAPITLSGSTAVAGGRTYRPSGEQYEQMLANKAAAEQNYTYSDAPPAGTSPPADAPPADTPPAGYQRFNLLPAFSAGAPPINFSSSFENVFGPPPVNPGQGSPDYGFYQIDVRNYELAQNTWNSMSPEQRAGTTEYGGTPVNNFVVAYGQGLSGRAGETNQAVTGGTSGVGTNTTGNTGSSIPIKDQVVGDLFPDPTARVIPTLDMVRQQSLEGPMLSGRFLDTRQNPQVYQLPTQGYGSQQQDPFGINVRQTTRPLKIPERIIPAPPQPQPSPEETGMADPTQGGVTN